MRELILHMSMSLDGFVSGLDGKANWIFSGDQEAIAWKVENSWNASLHIMGSRSFQNMARVFPTATTEFAAPMNQIPKAVFSKQGLRLRMRLPPSSKASRAPRSSLEPRAGRKPM